MGQRNPPPKKPAFTVPLWLVLLVVILVLVMLFATLMPR